MARYAIVTGEGGMEGYAKVPPRIGGQGWPFWAWAVMAIAKLS